MRPAINCSCFGVMLEKLGFDILHEKLGHYSGIESLGPFFLKIFCIRIWSYLFGCVRDEIGLFF
jgi:hypothetical protein